MIVRESISFQRGLDPKKALEVGLYAEKLNPSMKDLWIYPEGTYFVFKRNYPDYSYILCQVMRNNGKTDFMIKISWAWKALIYFNYDSKLLETRYHLCDDKQIRDSIFSVENIYSVKAINPADVNESVSFKRGLDPKQALGVGKKAMIIAWFEDIERKNGKHISFDIVGDNIYADEFLDLRGIEVDYIPDNLTIQGALALKECSLDKLPHNLKVNGNLYLRGSNIISLPPDLYVKGNLFMHGSKITEVPDSITVGGMIFKD